ncbi:unnamed protein product [Oncorhynchus mykiss]|uniref:Uncharacterized protein n=1 Tax=Oncorhynchus mykiss TaxID=8022 RepID=A0A060W084_ONCMY|nr:unnamed protein product [Oncorhynchus mykiss]
MLPSHTFLQFSQAPAVRSYTKFVMGIAVSVLTYPFMLVADLMAVNNCGLVAGLPPNSPIFKSWVHCWAHLSHEVQSRSFIWSKWNTLICVCVCVCVWHIKKLIKQHDHYTGAPCAGDIKRPL